MSASNYLFKNNENRCKIMDKVNRKTKTEINGTTCAAIGCGNKNDSKETIKITCKDGAWDNINQTSCKNLTYNFINSDGTITNKYFTDNDYLKEENLNDGSSNTRSIYEVEFDIKCTNPQSSKQGIFDWCQWETGDYGSCSWKPSDPQKLDNDSRKCSADMKGIKIRSVECSGPSGSCNPNKEPSVSSECDLALRPISCVTTGGWSDIDQPDTCYKTKIVGIRDYCNNDIKEKEKLATMHNSAANESQRCSDQIHTST